MPDYHKEQKKNPSASKQHNSKSDHIVFYDHIVSKKKSNVPQHTDNEEVTLLQSQNSASKQNNHKAKPKRKFKLSKKRVALNAVCSILAVLMIIVGTGCVVAYHYFNRINYQQLEDIEDTSTTKKKNQNSTNGQTSDLSGTPEIDTYQGALLNDPMILNIMLFGADTRKGATSGQSDTMILFSIDTRHQKMKMLSFMRDTYVDIPGDYESQKLNASYTFGGASLAVKTIELNYGIQIDRYAVVDFKSFKNIINALGGIDIEISDEEIDYINWQLWVNNQSDTRYEIDVNDYNFHTNIYGERVTTVHLNGQQALWHARNRGEDGICSGDDYDRTQRQREVVSIILNRLKHSDFQTIMSVVYEIGPMITTNLKTSEITKLATNIMNYLEYDIVSESAPLAANVGVDFYYSDDYNPIYVNGEQVDCIVIYDWNAFRQKVAEFIFEEEVEQITTSE